MLTALFSWKLDALIYFVIRKKTIFLSAQLVGNLFFEKYSISGTDILELAHTVTRYILVFSGGLGIFTKINGICRVSENGL